MIGLFQSQTRPLDKDHNLDLLERTASAASACGVSLMCFPELFLTGYKIDRDLHEHGEGLGGPSVKRVCKIARMYGIGLIFGMPERADSMLFNTAVAVDANGRVVGSYRKIHLFGPEENAVFTPGDEVVVLDMDGLRVGLAICYDIEFPEMARALRRAGAEVIAVPTANMHPFVSVPTTFVRSRALENGLPVIYANHSGETAGIVFTGGSCIVAYDGTDRARAGATGTAVLMCDSKTLFAVGADKVLVSTQVRDLKL